MPEDQRPLRDRIPVCPHGNKDSMKNEIISHLDYLEKNLGWELVYNSGFRCPACNAAAGGAKNSAHMRGKAVDVGCLTSYGRFKIIGQAIDQGIKRIGIGRAHVHLDIDESLPQKVAWLY